MNIRVRSKIRQKVHRVASGDYGCPGCITSIVTTSGPPSGLKNSGNTNRKYGFVLARPHNVRPSMSSAPWLAVYQAIVVAWPIPVCGLCVFHSSLVEQTSCPLTLFSFFLIPLPVMLRSSARISHACAATASLLICCSVPLCARRPFSRCETSVSHIKPVVKCHAQSLSP